LLWPKWWFFWWQNVVLDTAKCHKDP
jgi:hypothetical protein